MPSGNHVEVIARKVMPLGRGEEEVNALSACAAASASSSYRAEDRLTLDRTSAPAIARRSRNPAPARARRPCPAGANPGASAGAVSDRASVLRRSRCAPRRGAKERAMPKQVEIVRIHVTIVAEAVPGFAVPTQQSSSARGRSRKSVIAPARACRAPQARASCWRMSERTRCTEHGQNDEKLRH